MCVPIVHFLYALVLPIPCMMILFLFFFFFFQAEDGIRDHCVTGVQTCALPIYHCRRCCCPVTTDRREKDYTVCSLVSDLGSNITLYFRSEEPVSLNMDISTGDRKSVV